MRTLLFALSSALVVGVSAQTFLTRGEVYDFHVGDVFQAKSESWTNWGPQSPPLIYTDTILTRTEAGNSITYTKKHWTVMYQNYPQPAIVNSSIDTVVITGLDQPAGAWFPLCDPVDTLSQSTEQCGVECWLWTNGQDTCEMYEWYRYWFYRGCGGPYSLYYHQDGGTMYDLVYFHKDTLECGSFWDLPTAVPETIAPTSAGIFPNPVTSTATIQGLGPQGALILDALGRSCGAVRNGAQVDLTYLAEGSYRLIGTDAQGRPVRLPFVKR